jgi:hypothetical protein
MVASADNGYFPDERTTVARSNQEVKDAHRAGEVAKVPRSPSLVPEYAEYDEHERKVFEDDKPGSPLSTLFTHRCTFYSLANKSYSSLPAA